MKKIVLFICLSIILPTLLISQEIPKWLLLDLDTKNPIQYAHVINLNNQAEATLTNQDGEFAIAHSTMENDSFYISHIGYSKTIISVSEMMKSDTIFLNKESVELSEIVLYDVQSILEKVYKNISINYPATTTNENFFFRYFTKQDGEKFQIAESIFNLKRPGYFLSNKNNEVENEIKICANSTIKNVKFENIEFKPYSFQDIVEMMDLQLNITNEYEHTTETIEKDRIKILFNSTDKEKTKSGEFIGYLIINLKDYAILEMFYEKNYSKGATLEDIKRGYKKESIYKSGLRRWKLDAESKKYKLELMFNQDDLELTNTDKDLKILYEGSYLASSIDIDPLNFPTKAIKVKSKKKSLVDYKTINESQVQENSIMLKTKEQQFDLEKDLR